MKKWFFLIFIVFFIKITTIGQELLCNIQIVTNQIQGTNKQIFQTMQRSIYEFMNNTVWTNHNFSINERIECNLMFNLKEQIGADQFRGTLQIQVRRPVYNSSYNTVLFNFVDEDIDFQYIEFQPLEFNENAHISNLTSILAYYAYIILGIDYDSFSLKGGTPFFQMAEKIVNNAQNTKEKGWKAAESPSRKNRYWLVKSFLNEEYSPVREFIYIYHRQGLDLFYDKLNEGRNNVVESLKLLQKVYRQKPDPYLNLIKIILDPKSDELINIFNEAFEPEKQRVYEILKEIDPSNSKKYEKIIKKQ